MTTLTVDVVDTDAPMKRRIVMDLIARQETTLVLVILAVGVFASVRSDVFLTTSNIAEIFRATVVFFVMGCGTALLVIGGGLDFSAGASFTLGSLSTSLLLVRDIPWPVAVLVGLAAGAGVGIVNHLAITYGHVPPIIATLGTFFVLIGVDNLISQGADVLPLPDSFNRLGQTSTLGLPNIIWYAIGIGLLSWFLLERTRFGVHTRALGGNRLAAVGNGVRAGRVDLALYVLAAGSAALAGIIQTARVGAGQVQGGGTGTTLTVITAVLIGGVSILGGRGTITGVALGALLLSEIDNALIVTAIPPEYNSIVIGSVLVAAVAVDHLRRQRLYKKLS